MYKTTSASRCHLHAKVWRMTMRVWASKWFTELQPAPRACYLTADAALWICDWKESLLFHAVLLLRTHPISEPNSVWIEQKSWLSCTACSLTRFEHIEKWQGQYVPLKTRKRRIKRFTVCANSWLVQHSNSNSVMALHKLHIFEMHRHVWTYRISIICSWKLGICSEDTNYPLF